MNSTETFAPIPGFPLYRVSTLGRVQTCRARGHAAMRGETRPWKDVVGKLVKGYRVVGLRDESGRRFHWGAHIFVLLAFRGPCPPGMECRHLNGNRVDNRLSNVVWGTKGENGADRIAHGTSPKGSRHGLAKLDEIRVADMRADREAGMTYAAIGRKHGVTDVAARLAILGLTWGHVG